MTPPPLAAAPCSTAVALVPDLRPALLARRLRSCAAQCRHYGWRLVAVTTGPATAVRLTRAGHALIVVDGRHRACGAWPPGRVEPAPPAPRGRRSGPVG